MAASPISMHFLRSLTANAADCRAATNAAANVAGRELFGTIPGNALPETPRVGRDKIVFNGATYRIVAVEEKFSQNVLVDVVVSATRI